MIAKMSIMRRIIYLIFGICGILATLKTGFWYHNTIGSIIHSIVMISSINWGIVGITGRDIVEWVEIGIRKK